MNYPKLIALAVFGFLVNALAAFIILRNIVSGEAIIIDYLLLIPVAYFALRLGAYSIKFTLLYKRGW